MTIILIGVEGTNMRLNYGSRLQNRFLRYAYIIEIIYDGNHKKDHILIV